MVRKLIARMALWVFRMCYTGVPVEPFRFPKGSRMHMERYKRAWTLAKDYPQIPAEHRDVLIILKQELINGIIQ